MNLQRLMVATIAIFAFIILSGCKTQSQIRREQHMENLTSQVSEGQRLTADTTIRIHDMQERINELQGALEEKGYAEQIERQRSLTDITQRLDALEKNQEHINNKMDETTKQLEAQKSYLDEVLKTLRELSQGSTSSVKKKSTDQVYQQALKLYRSADYGGSRTYFQELLDRNVKGSMLAHSYHNMGMIEYIAGRDQEAIVFFSRLFTEFSDSGYNRNGLFFLAKSFERQGQKNEAKQTLRQLINRFPDARRINDAKEMLKTL